MNRSSYLKPATGMLEVTETLAMWGTDENYLYFTLSGPKGTQLFWSLTPSQHFTAVKGANNNKKKKLRHDLILSIFVVPSDTSRQQKSDQSGPDKSCRYLTVSKSFREICVNFCTECNTHSLCMHFSFAVSAATYCHCK